MSSDNPLSLVRKHVRPDTPNLPAKVRDEVALLLMNEIGVTAGDVIVELCRRIEQMERHIARSETVTMSPILQAVRIERQTPSPGRKATFREARKEIIEKYAADFKKLAENGD